MTWPAGHNVAGHAPFREILVRRARSTGTTVVLNDRGGWMGGDARRTWGDWRWETICVDHGTVCSHETRALATSFLSHPEEWCEDCMAADGGWNDPQDDQYVPPGDE